MYTGLPSISVIASFVLLHHPFHAIHRIENWTFQSQKKNEKSITESNVILIHHMEKASDTLQMLLYGSTLKAPSLPAPSLSLSMTSIHLSPHIRCLPEESPLSLLSLSLFPLSKK